MDCRIILEIILIMRWWLFRFPGGEFSIRSLSLMQQMGYTSLFWSFWIRKTGMSTIQPTHDFAMEKIMSNLHPGRDNAPSLGEARQTSRYFLRMIERIQERGFVIKPLRRDIVIVYFLGFFRTVCPRVP
jgi:hypothetical protein